MSKSEFIKFIHIKYFVQCSLTIAPVKFNDFNTEKVHWKIWFGKQYSCSSLRPSYYLVPWKSMSEIKHLLRIIINNDLKNAIFSDVFAELNQLEDTFSFESTHGFHCSRKILKYLGVKPQIFGETIILALFVRVYKWSIANFCSKTL